MVGAVVVDRRWWWRPETYERAGPGRPWACRPGLGQALAPHHLSPCFTVRT
jgi:hypothetical protein